MPLLDMGELLVLLLGVYGLVELSLLLIRVELLRTLLELLRCIRLHFYYI